jgi:type VI secretion system ImpA family protein
MPLRQDILAPIPGETPSGIDLRYDNTLLIYDQIKEARREDDDLAQGAWQIERKTANFPLVVALAEGSLARVSKDLQLAAWLTEALLHTEQFAGLRRGLELCLNLLTDFWDTIYPVIEDGDRELRARPLNWIGSQLDHPLRSTSIVSAGYSWFDYANSRAVGYEEQAWTDLQKKKRSFLIANGKLAPEDFDNSVAETPKVFYLQTEKDLDGCIEALAKLDKFCEGKFEDDAPTFEKLKIALADVRSAIHSLLLNKREREPDVAAEDPAFEAATVETTEDSLLYQIVEQGRFDVESASRERGKNLVSEFVAEVLDGATTFEATSDPALLAAQPLPTFTVQSLPPAEAYPNIAAQVYQEKLLVSQLLNEAERLTVDNQFSVALELLKKIRSGAPGHARLQRLREVLQKSQEQEGQGGVTRLIQRLSQGALETPQVTSHVPPPPMPTSAGPGEFTRMISASPAAASSASAPLDELPRFIASRAPASGTTLVNIFYATDRMQIFNVSGKTQFGKQRSLLGSLHYGRCEVSIPKTHKLGKLETPSILRLEFKPNPARHILLSGTFSVEEREFFELVNASVARSAAQDAFVFVHGYNVSFENAARRTGQMAFDLNFVGAPIFYSWPSNGKTADYPKDETNITWSTPHLQRFLNLLAQNTSAKRIYVIAHSMGNRAVCDALKMISYDSACGLKLAHLVLAAPDIDADTFRELATTLQKLSARITLYESSKDMALLASKKIHGNPRAGEPLLVIPGLDTIDASAIDTNFLGHSYFSDTWPLLSDIHSILFEDQPPERRFGLAAREDPAGKYYAFRA